MLHTPTMQELGRGISFKLRTPVACQLLGDSEGREKWRSGHMLRTVNFQTEWRIFQTILTIDRQRLSNGDPQTRRNRQIFARMEWTEEWQVRKAVGPERVHYGCICGIQSESSECLLSCQARTLLIGHITPLMKSLDERHEGPQAQIGVGTTEQLLGPYRV